MHIHFEKARSKLSQGLEIDVALKTVLSVGFAFASRVVHLYKCTRNYELQKNAHNVRENLSFGSLAHLVHYNEQ